MYAGFWRRAAASMLDTLILAVLSYLLKLVYALFVGATLLVFGGDIGLMAFFHDIALQLALSLFYWVGMEASSCQATLGKMAVGIKVTDEYGRRLTFGRAFGRRLCSIFSALLFGIGYLMCAFSVRKQCLHDMMTGCLVVSRDARRGQPLNGTMPGAFGMFVLTLLFSFLHFVFLTLTQPVG